MGIDKSPENIHRLDRRREGDRVFIKRERLEKYVGEVKVPEEDLNEWLERKEEAESHGEGDPFLSMYPHPKAALVSSQFFIIAKESGGYLIAPLPSSPESESFWVDVDDVQDEPPPASIQR